MQAYLWKIHTFPLFSFINFETDCSKSQCCGASWGQTVVSLLTTRPQSDATHCLLVTANVAVSDNRIMSFFSLKATIQIKWIRSTLQNIIVCFYSPFAHLIFVNCHSWRAVAVIQWISALKYISAQNLNIHLFTYIKYSYSNATTTLKNIWTKYCLTNRTLLILG